VRKTVERGGFKSGVKRRITKHQLRSRTTDAFEEPHSTL